MTQAAGAHLTWRIKASTLCNLRCRYCYEWDRLADTARLSLPDWRKIYRAAAEHQAIVAEQSGCPAGLQIVLHGGEPLLLPLDYLDAVLEIQHDVLGDAARLGVQTNLTVLPDKVVDFLRRNEVTVSVSWDGVPAARLDLGNQPSDERVLRNIERLSEREVSYGVHVVLGNHNRHRLPAIYDRLEILGAGWLSVIPIFLGSTPKSAMAYLLPDDAVYQANIELYEHWLASGRNMPVMPICGILRSLAGQSGWQPKGWIRQVTVHPDCGVSIAAGTADRVAVIGNLRTSSIHEILNSSTCQDSLQRRAKLYGRHCASCRFQDVCDGKAVLEIPNAFAAGPCPIVSRLYEYVLASLRRHQTTAAELLGWTEEPLAFEPNVASAISIRN